MISMKNQLISNANVRQKHKKLVTHDLQICSCKTYEIT